MIFNRLYAPDDEMYLVVTSWSWSKGNRTISPRIKVFRRYVKNQKALRDLYCQGVESDDKEVQWFQYVLPCQVKEVKTHLLFQAIGNKDMGLRPYVDQWCYLINVSRRLIFHMYDDRGLDVIASTKDSLQGIHVEYNDWILNYDRDSIDAVFKTS